MKSLFRHSQSYAQNLKKNYRYLFLSTLSLLTGTGFLFAPRSVQAAPLDCSSIYADVNDGKQIYSLSTTNATPTQVATLPLNSKVGIAILSGATPTLYSDSPSYYLQSTNGTTTSTSPTATFGATYQGGLGVDTSNRLFFIGRNSAGSQFLMRFNSTTSVALNVGTITPAISGDTIWAKMFPGDMMSDANGRLYYFGSDYVKTGGLYNNYLYYVDSSLKAHLLGSYTSAQTGIGVAFDPAGNIYTLNRNLLYKIDLTNGFSATLVGDTGNSNLIDMASCALPSMNANVSGIKTVRNVTTNQNPAITVRTNDILEYNIVIQNTGNLPSNGSRFIDIIPPGSSYIASSTKQCNATGVTCSSVADISGAPPFLGTGMLVNSTGQSAGIVLAGAANKVVVKFQVKVTSTGIPSTIVNAGKTNYPTVSGGTPTINSVSTTTASVPLALPDLTIAKSHAGNFTQGGTGAYSLTVGNIGTAATSGIITVTDTLPTGLSVPAGNVTPTGANAANWSCNAVAQIITCTSSTAIAISGSSTFGFNVAVANNAPATVTNNVVVSGGNEAATENGNNSATDPTTVTSTSTRANLLLVKRITAINGDRIKNPNNPTMTLNTFVDDTTSSTKTNDNHCNWQTATGTPGACTNTYLVGAINPGKVKSGDDIEYTIYYLNSGTNKGSARICSILNPNLTFQLQDGNGIGWSKGSASMLTLTNIGTDNDKGQLTDASAINCNLPNNGGTEVVVVDVGDTINPLMGSTGAGNPTSSYGYIRFKAKVK